MSQDAPATDTVTTVTQYKSGTFDQYLTYCAVGGLITAEDGKISRMSLEDFCQQAGINRKTAYRWRQNPDFAMQVRERREEVFPLARETAAFNRLYLIGMTGTNGAAVEALKTLLGHFSNLKPPTKQQEPESINNWADLVNVARKKMIIDN